MSSYPIPGFHDPFSSLSHLLGAGVFLVLGVFLLRGAIRRFGVRVSLGVFWFSAVFLLAMSGVYHLLGPGAGRYVLQHLDHAAIFVLIAGTFTPVHAILFRRLGRWGMLALIWAAAATAISLKMVFFDSVAEWLSLVLYLAMGWIGIVSGAALYRRHGLDYVRPLIYGALAYTAGAVLEFLRAPVLIPGVLGPHELFHIAVLVGLGWHWAFIHRISRARPAFIAAPTAAPPAAAQTR